MSTDLLSARPSYRRSGRVNWVFLFPLMILTFVAAVVSAIALCMLYQIGFYYRFFAPVLVAAPIALACYLAVRWSHCRNLAVAGVIGLTSGLINYPGHYHVDFVSQAGGAFIFRIDLLPRFIAFRMNTDVDVDNGQQAKNPDVIGNWLAFGLEEIVVLATVIGAGVYMASQPYCEDCRRWMRRSVALAPAGAASRVALAIAQGRLGELPPWPATEVKVTQIHSKIMVEFCGQRDSGNDCHIYLTLQGHASTSGFGTKSKAQSLMRAGQISFDELKVLISKIARWNPAAPLGLAPDPPENADAALRGDSTAAPAVAGVATIEDQPGRTAESVYTRGNTAIAIILSLFPIATFLVGVGFIVIAWWLQPWAAPLNAARVLVASCWAGAGLTAMIFGGIVCFVNVDYFNFIYGHWITKNEILLRPDVIVNPNDSRASYVEIVPRKHWSGLMADHASDGGFIVVDEPSRHLLFEGAKQRYRIPGDAIVKCETETINPDAGRFAFYVAVVTANVERQYHETRASEAAPSHWEAPFMVRPVHFVRFTGEFRRRSCEQLCNQIRRIM